MLKDNVTVSVVMITYNHEEFIKEAIEGVLMQVCNFNVELIIADDSSPDQTEQVVLDLIENNKNGHWIKYVKHQPNKGMMPNFIWALKECKGDFIALCEGDDYWVDEQKLQKQVDFLKDNEDYTFSMGRVDVFNEHTGELKKRKEHVNPEKSDFFTLKDYLKESFSQTSSFLFRNEQTIYPDWFYKVHAGDQSLVVIKTGKNGKIKYHPELFSVYRVHDKSITFTREYNPYCKSMDTLKIWNRYLDFDYNLTIRLRNIKFYLSCKSTNKDSKFFFKVLNSTYGRFYDFLIKII